MHMHTSKHIGARTDMEYLHTHTNRNTSSLTVEFMDTHTHTAAQNTEIHTQTYTMCSAAEWKQSDSAFLRLSALLTEPPMAHTLTQRNRLPVLWLLQLIKPILCCSFMMINLVYHS